MWLGFAAAIVIALIAGAVVTQIGDDTATHFSTTSTRL
jgi:hypothetical protein